MKKFHPEKKHSNMFVKVVFTGKRDREYVCTGVLVREHPEYIRVAFNAVEDDVLDYLDIPNKKIISIKQVRVLSYKNK